MLKIRDARISDYKSLCDIFAKANDWHCELRPDYYQKVRPIISKRDFCLAAVAQRFESGRKRVCAKIAELDDKNVGAVFALSVKRRSLGWSKHEKEAYLDNIFVEEEFRRRGIGTALLNTVKEWAKKTEHSYLYTKIVSSNDPSRRFFSANGCEETDVIAGADMD